MTRSSLRRSVNRVGVVSALVAVVLVACKRSASESAAPSASVPAPVPSALPIQPEIISRTVNPKGEKAYSGPTATIRGVVRATGDAPLEQPDVVQKIPADCPQTAREMYGKAFREGAGRTLGDVFVAVTGYEGYVPSREQVAVVEGRGCAWSTRTVGVTFGERIDIVSKDRRPYVPDLLGAHMAAQIIALPGGAGSALYPQRPGRYVLVDSLRIYATAEVLVVKYSTFDVTGLDGKFEISGIPVGSVNVNAILPTTGATVERRVTLEAGKTVDLNLEIPFDATAFKQRLAAEAAKAPASSASAAPPVSPGNSRAPAPSSVP